MADEQTLIAALDLVTLPDPLLLEGFSETEAANLQRIQAIVSAPNVVGLGIGNKITAGQVKDDLALKFYVERKLPREALSPDKIIDAEIDLPGVDTISTDVEEIGPVQLESYTTKVRPAIPGYSVGEVMSLTGTLGCLVRQMGNANDLFILSNAHVLARSGLGHPGDAVIQPGPDDGASASNQIATLFDFAPFRFGPTETNLCDIAIAKLLNANLATAFIAEIGIPAGVNTVLTRGMTVQKTGRTTGHTIGTIKDVNYRTNALAYPMVGGGTGKPWFVDQVLCERFTANGDSGSLVCDLQGRAVGVHWAGSMTISAFHKIQNVITVLGLQLVTLGD